MGTCSIALVGGSPSFDKLSLGFGDNQLYYGPVITAIVAFIILAAVVYFVLIVPVTKAREKFGPTPAEEAEAEEITLLREIRDSLQNKA